jgi:hypothetical protein
MFALSVLAITTSGDKLLVTNVLIIVVDIRLPVNNDLGLYTIHALFVKIF